MVKYAKNAYRLANGWDDFSNLFSGRLPNQNHLKRLPHHLALLVDDNGNLIEVVSQKHGYDFEKLKCIDFSDDQCKLKSQK